MVVVASTASGKRIVERTPLGGIPLLRRRLETLPEERLVLINGALNELMHLLEVQEDE